MNAVRAWQLWVWEEVGARVVTVAPGGAVALAEGASVRLRAAEGARLELSADRRANAFLNDVQLAGETELRPGDLLRVGACEAVVLARSEPVPNAVRELCSRPDLEARLVEALARQGEEVAYALVHAPQREVEERLLALWPRWLFAQVGAETWEGVGFVPAFEGLAGPDVRVGLAVAGEDGMTADELREAALARLVGEAFARWPEEPVALDGAMVRLAAWIDRAGREGRARPVIFEGERGTGRGLWARRLLRLRSANGPVRLVDARRGLQPIDEALREEGPLLVRSAESLDPETMARVIEKGGCLTVEAASSVHASASQWRGDASWVPVPALRDRTAEILPLAQRTLEGARRWLGRRSLAFGEEAREALRERQWPGNVRALQNAVWLAALGAESDEIRAENLPDEALAGRATGGRLRRDEPDLRRTLRTAEKDVLLATLARTRWNVSQTARELGLPRRTVVYRMSRLGLRRPS